VIARQNKTSICSVVFLDIVDYSMKPVEIQIKIKEHLNKHVAEAIKDVAVNDRLILDSGDGAAICFLGDPEDALFCALSLRDAVVGDQQDPGMPLSIRIGINLGPVKLVKDINKRQNLIGDGINVAQRVMSFAAPGQVLVSRSYFEVVSCLSQEYAKLFHYLGMRADKHVREHELYSVEETAKEPVVEEPAEHDQQHDQQEDAVDQEKTEVLKAAPAEPVQQLPAPVSRPDEKPKPPTVPSQDRPFWHNWLGWLKKNWLYPAIPIAFGLIVVLFLVLRSPKNDQTEATALDKADAVPSALDEHPKDAPPAKTGAKAGESGALAVEAPAGVVQFAITPWGEVYADGQDKGPTPPLNNLSLPPGKHRIEIKNASFHSYVEDVNLKVNEKIKITHTFR
jgi:hypothetical protein